MSSIAAESRVRLDRRKVLLGFAGGTLLAATGTRVARAQTYPNRIVKIVVPFTAGGSTDSAARIIAEQLGKILGRNVIVENKPGGRTLIATDSVAKSAPDGHTILFVPGSFMTNAAFGVPLPYDTVKDFTPVIRTLDLPMMLACSPRASFTSIPELIAAGRKDGDLFYAVVGTGSTTHLWAELLKLRYGLPIQHVPYKGSSEALTDVLGERVPLLADVILPSGTAVQSGALRGLAIATTNRFELLPNVPTVAEAGLPGMEAASRFGLTVPSGTPSSIVNKLNEAVNEVLNDPAIRSRLTTLGYVTVGGTPDDYSKFLASEITNWRSVIQAAKIPAPT